MLKLDHQSSIPLRAQVEQLLRELVRQPQYLRGALLPQSVGYQPALGWL
jgi:GntR family transcriptional regulator